MKNKETLEEIAERLVNRPYGNVVSKSSFIAGAKWQAERSYSDEDLEKAYKEGGRNEYDFINKYHCKARISFEKWFEQFKKPNTWYNEEQTNKRMNVIGQNGNDGTHYENK